MPRVVVYLGDECVYSYDAALPPSIGTIVAVRTLSNSGGSSYIRCEVKGVTLVLTNYTDCLLTTQTWEVLLEKVHA